MQFENRRDAGRDLAGRLTFLRGHHPIVLGLPRGGVVVAKEIADALKAPLDILLARKIGTPGQPELAIGAVGEGGVLVANDEVLHGLGLARSYLEEAAAQELVELERRATALRRGRPALSVVGQVVILVDDGMATGATVRAAIRVLRARGARWIVLAVPVAPADTLEEISDSVNQTVCPNSRVRMQTVGNWYRDFSEVSDSEVVALLQEPTELPDHLASESWSNLT